MTKRTVVLVDGQNLYYYLHQIKLLEKDIEWSRLFCSFLEANDELIRAYWFRPQRIQDGHLTPDAIKNQVVYKHYNGCYANYKNGNHEAIDPATLMAIENDARAVEDWLQEQRTRFHRIEYSYDQLCLDNADIEIVKKGIVKVNPYKKEYNGEKV